MEPFNLERALAVEPVVTRDGRDVTEIHYFKTDQGDYPIVAIIEGSKAAFTEDGFFSSRKCENTFDLFMKPKVVEGWFNVYVNNNGIVVTGVAYPSEEVAKANIAELSAYIKTIKITNEMKY